MLEIDKMKNKSCGERMFSLEKRTLNDSSNISPKAKDLSFHS